MSLSNILDQNTADEEWKVLEVNKVNTVSDVNIGGNLQVAGSSTFNGPVNFNSNGPLLPSADNVDDLGSVAKRWRSLYLGTNLNIDGTINSTASQCIQATGTIFTTGTIGANVAVNSSTINAQGNSNQLVFTQSFNTSVPTIINSEPSANARIYTIKDKGFDGNFAITDSTNNLTVNQLNYTTLNPPVSGYNPVRVNVATTTPQTIPNGAFTALTIATPYALSDPQSNFSAGVVTPNIAGNYSITAQINFDDAALGNTRGLALYKNASLYQNSVAFIAPDVAGRGMSILDTIVNVNGSTDNLQLYAYQDTGGDLNCIRVSLSVILVD